MNHRRFNPWLIGVIGLILVTDQGCSTKWMVGGSESSEESAAQSKRSSGFPDLTKRGSADEYADGGRLQGLDRLAPGQGPTEERLNRDMTMAKLEPPEAMVKKRAELRREEAAAMEAGLKDVFFPYDRWGITDDGMHNLMLDAEWLKQHPKAQLRVGGHCDERGSQDYNLVLGEKRAKTVRNYLTDLGVNPKQLSIVSYGKEQPFCSEHDEVCYQKNRRGHMLLRVK